MRSGLIESFVGRLVEPLVHRFPWITYIAPVVIILGLIAVAVLLIIYFERKVSAHIQSRLGPMHHGPHGIIQTFADALKLLHKEDLIPECADRALMIIAPFVVFIPAVMVYVVIPFGPGWIVRDLNIGVLYLCAVTAITTLGVLSGGWAGNNKWSLLGGLRAAAQVISYEIPMVLSMIVVVMLAGSMSMVKIVEAQNPVPFVLYPCGLVAFLTYFTSALAEVCRNPFDLPEAESELVAGYHTEYTGFRFAIFFMAEFANVMAVSMIAATLFFGGWLGPFGPSVLWFAAKTVLFIFVFMWIKWTLPRLRIDQLLRVAWLGLIPICLANIGLAVAVLALKAYIVAG